MKPHVTDDFGDLWVWCHFTGRILHCDEAVKFGSFIPGVKNAEYYRHRDESWRVKESRRSFNESEGNCNTCRLFVRVPHKKEPAGFVHGGCSTPPFSHPLLYRREGNQFWVHPDDPMGMSCYESRG